MRKVMKGIQKVNLICDANIAITRITLCSIFILRIFSWKSFKKKKKSLTFRKAHKNIIYIFI